MFILQVFTVAAMMVLGARFGGIFFGMAGGLGLAVLIFVFKVAPSSPPIDVMLIMLSVIVAASTLQASGGMRYLVKVAEYLLRKNPNRITFVAPLVAYVFTFFSGTGNVLYNILPVIAEVARGSGIRPERPVSISVIASQQAITACPISAATVAMVALLAPKGISLAGILFVSIPATLTGVLAGALLVNRIGKPLKEDPVYLDRLRNGLVEAPTGVADLSFRDEPRQARLAVSIFLLGALMVVLMGTLPWLRPSLTAAGGKIIALSMTNAIEVIMLCTGALIVMCCRVDVDAIISGSVFKTGAMGIVTVFGLAWMSNTLVHGNLKTVTDAIKDGISLYPWMFSFALFAISALTHSQAATVASVMPMGIALGIDPMILVGMFPAVCGYFLIPSTGVLIAGVAFDSTGTTKIGKYVVNHSYMIPGLVTTTVSVITGLLIVSLIA